MCLDTDDFINYCDPPPTPVAVNVDTLHNHTLDLIPAPFSLSLKGMRFSKLMSPCPQVVLPCKNFACTSSVCTVMHKIGKVEEFQVQINYSPQHLQNTRL